MLGERSPSRTDVLITIIPQNTVFCQALGEPANMPLFRVQRVEFRSRYLAHIAGRFNTVFLLELLHRDIGLVMEFSNRLSGIHTLFRECCLERRYISRV